MTFPDPTTHKWEVPEPTLTDTIVVPYRLFELFRRCKVEAAPEVRDDEVYVVDKEGHVHVLHYKGRLIDMEGDE